MRRVLAALATLVLLAACATTQNPLSYVERGARAAEVAYTSGVVTGQQLVLSGALEKDKFKELDFKAYGGLIVLRAAFAVSEPTNSIKPDYLALVGRSDAAHYQALGF